MACSEHMGTLTLVEDISEVIRRRACWLTTRREPTVQFSTLELFRLNTDTTSPLTR